MTASRTCSECGKSLRGKPTSAKTCGETCRKRRARRQKAERDANLAGLDPIANAVRAGAKDVLPSVMADELRPIVRESISQDVLNAIDKMMGLTPKLIARLEEDLDSSDDQVRGRAMTLLARYTLGNPAVAPQPDGPSGTTVEVHFDLPRPGDGVEAVDAEADELKVCSECDTERVAREFVDGSDRCRFCHDALQSRINARFGDA